MIVHPEFLMRTLGHFYRRLGDSASKGGAWELKDDAALLQTPQVMGRAS
jgi:hypothetical protein